MREFNFGGGQPDPKSFPWSGLAAAAQSVLAREGEELVKYPGGGYEPLREVASARFEKREGVSLGAENVSITCGSMQSIELVTRAFIEPGDIVVCEELTYGGSLGVFRRLGAELVGIAMDEDGMRMDALTDALEDLVASGNKPKMIYTIPSNQNPTGTVLPLERRKMLVELAKRYEIPVLEDDCYGDLNFTDQPYPPTLYALDDSGLVVFVGSFSKIMGPGLRLGYFAVKTSASEMRGKIQANRMDGGTSGLASMIVGEFAKEHLWEHIAVVNHVFSEKLRTLDESLEEHLGDCCTWKNPPGGMFLWVKLPEETDLERFRVLTGEAGLSFAMGNGFHYAGDQIPYFRLAFGYPPLDDIRDGVAALAECVRAALPVAVGV